MNDYERPAYRPKGLWTTCDFKINLCYWERVGIGKAYDIRLSNLCDLSSILSDLGVSYWLFGKTLWGSVKKGKLLDDHDDDIGVFLSSRKTIMSDAKARLENLGFSLIRDTDGIISFERGDRYIDLCLFRERGVDAIGYNKKLIDKKHLVSFESASLDCYVFTVPANASILIDRMYPSSRIRKLSAKTLDTVHFLLKARKLKRLPSKIKSKHVSLVERQKAPIRYVLESLASISGFSVCTLSYDEFMGLHVEPLDSFNWGWRYRHLSIVTDDAKITKVDDLVLYMSSPENRQRLDSRVEESDTSKPFHENNNFDMRFWWSGNNYFWYCVKYEFRKGVVPYSEANKYIEEVGTPLLYTSKYYESLEVMSESEIHNFLKSQPIVIENGCVTSGKHRVFAMIGRLASGKSYIPFKVISL